MALSACDVKAEHQQKSIGNHAGLAPPCDACVIHSRFARDEIINLVVNNKNPKCDLSHKIEINHRVYQIHKEGGVVNRFLTARRHF